MLRITFETFVSNNMDCVVLWGSSFVSSSNVPKYLVLKQALSGSISIAFFFHFLVFLLMVFNRHITICHQRRVVEQTLVNTTFSVLPVDTNSVQHVPLAGSII